MKSYNTIQAYIKDQSKEVQPLLKKLHATILAAAPKAEEAVKYGMPTYMFHGNMVFFGAFKNHLGFFPTPSGVIKFKKELAKYKTSKGTIQFPYNEPIPYSLVTKITKFRVKEQIALAKEKK